MNYTITNSSKFVKQSSPRKPIPTEFSAFANLPENPTPWQVETSWACIENLQRSGLNVERLSKEENWKMVWNSSRLNYDLRRGDGEDILSVSGAIRIPLKNLEEKEEGVHYRLLPSYKERKYLLPSGQKPKLFLGMNTRHLFGKPKVPLVIVEGAKKAEAVDQNEVPCLGFLSTTLIACRKEIAESDEDSELLPLAREAFKAGRKVYVAFDMDREDNPGVERQNILISVRAFARGCEVFIMHWNKEYKGIDDYLASHPKALPGLMEKATPLFEYFTPNHLTYLIKAIATTTFCSDSRRSQLIKAAAKATGTKIDVMKSDILRMQHPEVYELREPDFSDIAMAEEFAKKHGEFFRFNDKSGEILSWEKHRWKPGEGSRLYRSIVGFVKGMSTNVVESYKGHPNYKAFAKEAKQAKSKHKVESTIELVKRIPPVIDDGEGWDENPYLLGVLNCVVDLRTGKGRPGVRVDKISQCTQIEYDPKAKAPRWYKFLEEITGNDASMTGFLQVLAGYALTGLNREHKLFICLGSGRNGKSVFLNTLRKAAGDYGSNTPFSTFEASRNDGQTADLARLKGKRLVTASETNESRKLNEARVKAITGGEPITCRHLYQGFFEFTPQFTVLLSANYKPMVFGTDDGMWSRLVPIPFEQSFKGREDRNLESDLERELPGILAWMVEGATFYFEKGLRLPKKVLDSIQSWRDEEDSLGRFLEDCVIACPSGELKKSLLYEAYEEWCRENHETPMGNKTLHGKMLQKGYSEGRNKASRFWRDIALRDGRHS